MPKDLKNIYDQKREKRKEKLEAKILKFYKRAERKVATAAKQGKTYVYLLCNFILVEFIDAEKLAAHLREKFDFLELLTVKVSDDEDAIMQLVSIDWK